MSRAMYVEFERSGGFAAMRLAASIDTTALSMEEAQELMVFVREADFFALPGKVASAPSQADRFQYRITVDDGDRRHTVEMGDDTVSEPLRRLLRCLTILARSLPKE
jgi:hypothetical protein